MDGFLERAAQWGIETQHYDGLGRHWTVEPAVLARVLEAIGANDSTPGPQAPQAVNHVTPHTRATTASAVDHGPSRSSFTASARAVIGATAISAISLT